jgi:hypothetical protein
MRRPFIEVGHHIERKVRDTSRPGRQSPGGCRAADTKLKGFPFSVDTDVLTVTNGGELYVILRAVQGQAVLPSAR